MIYPPINDSPNCPEHGDTMGIFDEGKGWARWICAVIDCDYEINNEPDYE